MALNLEKQLLFVSPLRPELLFTMILTDFLSMELTTAIQYGILTLGQPSAWAYNYLGERGNSHHLCSDPAVHRYCSGTFFRSLQGSVNATSG